MRSDGAPSGTGFRADASSPQAVSPVPASIPSACFAFGDPIWPGLAKLAEECGEVVQVIGKLMMVHGARGHWSGDLRAMLLEEIADVEAAVHFLRRHNLTKDESGAHLRRVSAKLQKFEAWHADMDADPPPASAIEARSDETGTGSAVGESAVAKPDAENPHD